MVLLSDVRDFLKSFELFSGYSIGRIEETKTKQLGVYALQNNNRHVVMGNNLKYDVKAVSLLVHGTKNKAETEKLAQSLYTALDECKNAKIGGRDVQIIQLQYDEPIDVDVSESKIYEYVIEVYFYIAR